MSSGDAATSAKPTGDDDTDKGKDKPSQWGTVTLLFFLYLMQGVPMGFAFGSLPYLLQEAQASYSELAWFSAASYPFSLKLLWAPLVDALYWRAFGRRKSWIVPMQLAIGATLIVMSQRIDAWLNPQSLDVASLTCWFLVAMLCASAQDIAVDGWSVTLLHAHNQAFGSTCQTFGQSVGYALSYSAFFTFNNASFANRFVRSVPSDAPLISLSSFLLFWGVAFVVVTTGLALFKREHIEPQTPGSNGSGSSESACASIVHTYRKVWRLVRRLPHMQWLLAVLLTQKLAFMVSENVVLLKLTERGFSKSDLAFVVAFTFPCDLLYPLLASPIVRATPDRPLARFSHVYVLRLLLCVAAGALIAWYPDTTSATAAAATATAAVAAPAAEQTGSWSGWLILVLAFQITHDFLYMINFVQCSTYFTRIADESFGGSYYTLLATTLNLGFLWPRFVVLWGCDALGFELVQVTALLSGVLWLVVFHRRIHTLDAMAPDLWLAPADAAPPASATKPHAQ